MPYTESQKRAIYKYKLNNKEKINEQAKKDYLKIKNDPERYEKRNEKIRLKKIENAKKLLEENSEEQILIL
jgi:hypothetical protein